MAIIKCKMCGGTLEITNNETVAICEYCGTQQTLPKTTDEVTTNLYNRANTLRLKSEFDKAAQTYEKILEIDNAQAEAHWGIILCKYGIEYIEDPATFNRVPTCHRTQLESVMADADYLTAIEYADATQRSVYEKEAAAIDALQKDILQIVHQEKPFDVFLCYKETDENGKRTPDSVIANDIYYQLTQEGLKVFYAAITLENKLGQEYEPYIFAALNSAKVMLVLGTKPEYFSAVWVQNEWSRFMKLMRADRSKLLIPCYRDMDAYDLPEEFAHLQAQDMSKIGFINDVVRGIRKVIVKEEAPKPVVAATSALVAQAGNTAALLKRAFMFLEDGEWERADDFCEQVLNIDPECAEAYLGKLMIDLKVATQEGLKDCDKPFDGNSNYVKAVRFGDEGLKQTLTDAIDYINLRNENAYLEETYTRAKVVMDAAVTEDAYKAAAKLFESISGYKDAAALSVACIEKAEDASKDAILAAAVDKSTGTKIANYEQAIELLKSISGWKDADEKVLACQKTIVELREKQELARKEKKARAAKTKRIAAIVAAVAVVAISAILLAMKVIIPSVQYNKAVALVEAGRYVEAYEIFTSHTDYKDSKERAREVKDTLSYKLELLSSAEIGDSVWLGKYEQDRSSVNGKEDIEWLVLEVTNEKVLVISKYALDCLPYNADEGGITWEGSDLREWLNSDFFHVAFSEQENAMISMSTVSCETGNDTQDKIFLLSVEEAEKYVSSGENTCQPTRYAEARGAMGSDSSDNCPWWLRTGGKMGSYAVFVDRKGAVVTTGIAVQNITVGVRPAMWIDFGV